MTVHYEWDIEETDEHGDIVDHHFGDNLKMLLRDFGNLLTQGADLVLVRNEGNDAEGLTDRLWAYVENDRLPETFADAAGYRTGVRVPKRFHDELTRN